MKNDKSNKAPATSATSATQKPAFTYQDAVELAKSHFEKDRYFHECDLLTPSDHHKSVKKSISLMLLNQFPHWLNEDDPQGFETLRYAFSAKILAGEQIPESFRELAASFVLGEACSPPKKPGVKDASHTHKKIVSAIELLCEQGMKASRNDSSANTDSACDAVAEALVNLKLSPTTFRGVKDIWTKRDKQ